MVVGDIFGIDEMEQSLELMVDISLQVIVLLARVLDKSVRAKYECHRTYAGGHAISHVGVQRLVGNGRDVIPGRVQAQGRVPLRADKRTANCIHALDQVGVRSDEQVRGDAGGRA